MEDNKKFALYHKARDCSTRLHILRHLLLSVCTSRDTEEGLKFQHAPASQVVEGERLQRVVFIQLTSVASNAIHKLGPYQATVPLGICGLKTALQREWAIFCRMGYAFYSPHKKPV